MLFDLVDIFYSNSSPEDAIRSYLSSVPEKKLYRAVAYFKRRGMAYSAHGKKIVISSDLLKKHSADLQYAPFPKALDIVIRYYKDPSPEELLYIVDWIREAGIPDLQALEYIDRLYKVDDRISLDELTRCLKELSSAETNGIEEIYKTALLVMRSLGMDKSPGRREQDYIKKWTSIGFAEEDISLACCNAYDSPTFQYVDAILKNARTAMDSIGFQTYRDLDRFAKEYRAITGASGAKELTIPDFRRFVELRSQFSDEEIHLAAEYVRNEHGRTKNRLIYIQRVLREWRNRGLTDVKSIHGYLDDLENANALIGSIMLRTEIELPETQRKAYIGSIIKWRKAGIEEEDIVDAALAAYAAEAKKPLAYMHKVLNTIIKK